MYPTTAFELFWTTKSTSAFCKMKYEKQVLKPKIVARRVGSTDLLSGNL
jgi:hypothetical protein